MNKTITSFVILILASAMFMPSKILAGDIPEGEKLIDYCFKISNVDKFKDYVILFEDGSEFNKKQVKQNECVPFVFNGTPKFYALPKAEFNRAKFVENFKNPKLIASDIKLDHPLSVPIADRTNQIIDRLEIVDISPTKFEIKKVQAEFSFDNNKQENIKYENQDVRPTSSGGYSWAEQNLTLLVAGVIILVLLLAFVMRARLSKAARLISSLGRRKKKAQVTTTHSGRLGTPIKK
jgi:hypothetical protein